MPPKIVCPQPQRLVKRKFLINDDNDIQSSNIRRTTLFLFPENPSASQEKPRALSEGFQARRRDPTPPPRCESVPLEFSKAVEPFGPEGTSLSSYEEAVYYDDLLTFPPGTCLRVRSPSYRTTLSSNHIEINHLSVPASIEEYGRRIITRARDSPTMPTFQAQAAMEAILSNTDADESTLVSMYTSLQLVTTHVPYYRHINQGGKTSLGSEILPHNPPATRLPSPKPDQYFCIQPKQLEEWQWPLASLQPYAQPGRAGYFPYFSIEYESDPMGGTNWVAQNKIATSGAGFVNSMGKLLSVVPGHKRTELDSVTFSCTIVSQDARIWIHYCLDGRFYCSPLEYFLLNTPDAIIRFRNCVKNCVEFGISVRLPQIKALLTKICESESQSESQSQSHAQAQDKSQLIRKADDETPEHVPTKRTRTGLRSQTKRA